MADQKTHSEKPRINLGDPKLNPVMKALYGLEEPLRNSGLEPSLRELVKTRASQINGCAYCIDMHTKDARAQGETEHLTLIAEKGVPDELYARVKEHFSDEEIVNLTLAVVQINAWNRLAISVRAPVGRYQPAQSDRNAATA